MVHSNGSVNVHNSKMKINLYVVDVAVSKKKNISLYKRKI
jgi:hypothetical protein